MEIFCRLKQDESLKLNNSQYVSIVETGKLDLFIKTTSLNGDRGGDRKYLFSIEEKEAAFIVNSDSASITAIAIESGVVIDAIAARQLSRI